MCARFLPGMIRTILTLSGLAFFSAVSVAARDVQVIALSGTSVPGSDDRYFSAFPRDLRRRGVPAFNQAGEIAFLAQLRDDSASFVGSGVFAYKDEQLQLIAKTGDQAPGPDAGFLFTYQLGAPSLSEDGRVAFYAETRQDLGIEHRTGIWVEQEGAITPVVLSGDPVPGGQTPIMFGNAHTPEINSSGDVAFLGGVSRVPFQGGLFTLVSGEVQRIAYPGDPASGLSRAVFSPFSETSSFVIDEAGSTVFAETTGTGFVSYKIWKDFELLVSPGDQFEASPAAGMGPRELFSLSRQPIINPSGTYTFTGRSESIPASSEEPVLSIFSGQNGSLQEVVRIGQHVPGEPDEVTFASFLPYSVNSWGHTAFTAYTSLDSNSPSIWSEYHGALHLIAQRGSAVPGDPGNVFRLVSLPQLNNFDQTAFYGLVNLGGGVSYQGIWAEDRLGQLQLIAAPGMEVEVAPGTIKKIAAIEQPIVLTHTGIPMYFNDLGQVVFRATLDDGTEGIFVSNKIAVPEPTAPLLAMMSLTVLFRRSGSEYLRSSP